MLGLTAGVGLLMKGGGRLAYLLKRRLLVSLEIPSKDKSYSWFLEWMARQRDSHLEPRSWIEKSLTKNLHQLQVETQFSKLPNGSIHAGFQLVPGQGRHIFRYKGAYFQVERTRERAMLDIANGSPWETLSITTLSRDRGLFMEMLTEAKNSALSKEIGKTVIYTSFGPEWRPFGTPRRRRPLDSVILDGTIAQDILHDIQDFLAAGKWYNDRGIPFRRGFLFHGPPGSGKSSFIQSLAGELEFNICVMNLAELGMTDDRFAHLLNNIPPRSIILLEDVDAAFSDRTAIEAQKKGYQSTLTLSGLLNGLDGIVAAEERLIFMTTNHLSRLDPALTRPGRVDRIQFIGNASLDQIRRMFFRFYNGEEELCSIFIDKLKQSKVIGLVSPAQLQGHFVSFKNSAQDATDNVASLIQIHK